MGLRLLPLLRVGALALLAATCVLLVSPFALAATPGTTRSPTSASLLATSPSARGGHARQSEKETTVVVKQTASTSASKTTATNPETPVPVEASDMPPVGRHLSSDEALEIANRLPKMRAVRAKYKGSYGGAYLKGPTAPARWQVSYFSKQGKEIGQVIIADHNGKVLEQWTGFQIAWSMARGYPGAFGRHVNALYIWIPLCVLFFVPFFDWRKPLRLLHLDLLVLLSFSVSLAYFNHADIYASTPLVYPPLVYLLARMLALARVGRRGAPAREPRPLRLLVPPAWLAIGVVFLLGFRIGLNVTDSNVIDVGYAGVIGAQRIAQDRPLYGAYPSDNEHGDTYGPVNYEAYVPFQQVFGWSGHWDDLPAAHAAAIVFDLLAVALLFLLGRRVRGPGLGIVLAYAWVSYPFTLFALESNSNDSLVAVLILAALLVASSPPARGMFAALAGLTKFAPLALAPLLWTHGVRRAFRSRPRAGFGPVRARLRRDGGGRLDSRPDPRLAAHDLRAHARLPVKPRIAVLDLGPVWEPTHPWLSTGGCPRRGPGTGPVAGDLASPPRPDRPGRGRRRGARGGAAGNRTLVLPVHPLVLRPGDACPVGSGQLAGAGVPRAGAGGRAIRICSIESARSGLEARTKTPISHGSSLEVSKRTGICVTSASTACSRLTPITPPRGPVMPTSVM